jgi:hypothetical protein
MSQNIVRFGWMLVLFIVCSEGVFSHAIGDELTERAALWRERALLCKSDMRLFPSKSAVDPNDCDDGDMTLFNGLLCASGEKLGCDGVAHSFRSGRWWRSPRKIGIVAQNANQDSSFTPDQALGVLHYVVHTRDTVKFNAWVSWINNNRQRFDPNQLGTVLRRANITISPLALAALGFAMAQLPPHPVYCTDDFKLSCTLRHGDCIAISKTEDFLKQKGDVCAGYFSIDKFIENAKSLGVPVPELSSLAASYFNEANFPLHLAAVQIFLFQKSSAEDPVILHEAARHLAEDREPENPFFQYLAGNKSRALELTLKECPTRGKPSLPPTPSNPQQWSWERPDGEKAWLHSMYWDCIFMANLLQEHS